MAIKNRDSDKGLIFHSDRGSQYASHDFQVKLWKNGMISSMSRKGDCWDNAVAESFFATLKTELITIIDIKIENRQDRIFFNILQFIIIESEFIPL